MLECDCAGCCKVREGSGSETATQLFAVGENAIVTCSAGQVMLGGAGADMVCLPCSWGHFCRGGVEFPCPRGTWLNMTGAVSEANCTACPSPGTDCQPRSGAITVTPGWYLSDSLAARGYKCPGEHACLGGENTFGSVGCALGHTGLLCGTCTAGYYRGRFNCLSCLDVGDADESSQATVVLMTCPFLLLVLVITFYFAAPNGQPGSKTAWAGAKPASLIMQFTFCRGKLGALYRSLLTSHFFSVCTSLAKVLISFSQCLGTVKRLNRVKWPLLFVEFMERLDFLNLELFSVVPAECVTGDRLGFMFELLATVLIPIIMLAVSLLIVTVMHLTKMCYRVCCSSTSFYSPMPSLYSQVHQPRIYNLMLWVLLLMYPPLARKSLAFFHCVEAGIDNKGVPIFLMREDPAIRCYATSWWAWSPIAFSSIALYCIGLPLMSFKLTRTWRNTDSRPRIAVLINTYRDEHWYTESLSLLHKLFFTGVILHVATDERMQLWVGAVLSIAVFILYLLCRPMRHVIVDYAAVSSLLQLILVYTSAFVFFDDGGTSVVSQGSHGLGVLLVLINMTCFFVVIGFLVRTSMAERAKQRREAARQRFLSCDWKLASGQSYVCFISHVKATAGAEARYLNDTLEQILGCPVFLDTSNLADLRYLFIAGVHISQTLVVLLSEDLLTRPWCLLEIYEAVQMDKPIILVRMPHKPFSFDDALALVSDLEGKMPKRNPWCLDELRSHLDNKPLSMLQETLVKVIGGAIDGNGNDTQQVVRINLSGGTFNQLEAQVTNLIEKMHAALVQKSSHDDSHSSTKCSLKWKGIERGARPNPAPSPSAGQRSVVRRSFSALTRQRIGMDQRAKFIMVYHAVAAKSHAQMLSRVLERMSNVSMLTDVPTGSEAMESGLHEVESAKCLILLQTHLVLSQPWPLLATYWASLHGVPIVCVLVEGGGYDFAEAKRHLAALETSISSHALQQLDQVLTRSRAGKEMLLAGTGEAAPNAGSLQTHLLSLLPSVISVSYNPTGTFNELAATVHDIQDKLEAARGLVRKASIGATPPTCTKRSTAVSVQEGPVQAEKPGAAGAAGAVVEGHGCASSHAAARLEGMAAVSALLGRCRLEQYSAAFEEEGYDDLEFLLSLDQAGMAELAQNVGMKTGHVARLRGLSLASSQGSKSAQQPDWSLDPSHGRESESDLWADLWAADNSNYPRTPSPLPRPRRSVIDAISADRLATASFAEAESTAGKRQEEDIEEGLTA